MKRKRGLPLTLAAALLALPACRAAHAVADPIAGTASDVASEVAGFGQDVGLDLRDAAASILPPLGGSQVVQDRKRFRNPRTDREALAELRARRQALLKQTH